MGNMSYCRFENTHRDLQDCLGALFSMMEDRSEADKMNGIEAHHVLHLVRLCRKVADTFDPEDSDQLDRCYNEEEVGLHIKEMLDTAKANGAEEDQW